MKYLGLYLVTILLSCRLEAIETKSICTRFIEEQSSYFPADSYVERATDLRKLNLITRSAFFNSLKSLCEEKDTYILYKRLHSQSLNACREARDEKLSSLEKERMCELYFLNAWSLYNGYIEGYKPASQ